MKQISPSLFWIGNTDESLIPWMQEKLNPVDGAGEILDLSLASYINLYFGDKSIHLHLPPDGFADPETSTYLEKQFVASVGYDQMSDEIRAGLKVIQSQFEEQSEQLSQFETAMWKALMPPVHSDYKGLCLHLLIPGRWKVRWNFCKARVYEEEGGDAVDNSIRIDIRGDGNVLIMEEDDVEGGLILPPVQMCSTTELIEFLKQVERAFSKEAGLQQSIAEINRIFGPESPYDVFSFNAQSRKGDDPDE